MRNIDIQKGKPIVTWPIISRAKQKKYMFLLKIPPSSFKGKAQQNMFLINRTFILTLTQ